MSPVIPGAGEEAGLVNIHRTYNVACLGFRELAPVEPKKMNFLLLSICWITCVQGIDTAYTRSNNRIKWGHLDKRDTGETFLGQIFGDASDGEDELLFPDSVGGADEASLWSVSGDTADSADGIHFLDGNDLSLASAGSCDGDRSSLNILPDSSSFLDARDLADEFPGVGELVDPLNKLRRPVCSPTNQPSGAESEGGRTQKPDSEPDQWERDEQVYDFPAGECGGLGGGYVWPLCCDGGEKGHIVYGCSPCKYFQMNLTRLYVLQGVIAHQLRFSRLFHLMLSFLPNVLLPGIRCTGKHQVTSWPRYSNTFALGSNR